MNRTKLWLLLGGVLVATALSVAGSAAVLSDGSGAAEVSQPTAPVSLYVIVAEAGRKIWPVTLSATGVIAPWQEAVISSQVDGLRISSITVDVGDIVTRGQLLATLDDRMLRTQEGELIALLRQAQSTEAQARVDFERAEALGAGGALSKQEVLRYKTEATSAAARAEAAAAQLDAKRLEISYSRIRAPDDGVISARSAALGEIATNGKEFFRLIRQGRLEWRGEVTATQVSQVVAGQTVDLQLPDGQAATARTRQTSPMLAERSRLGTVYADVTGGETARAGMYASGTIVLEQSAALVVPASSVVVRDGRSLVFSLEDKEGSHVAVSLPVEIGRRNGRDVEVLSGIEDGAVVVVEGAEFLSDGDVVGIAPSPAGADL